MCSNNKWVEGKNTFFPLQNLPLATNTTGEKTGPPLGVWKRKWARGHSAVSGLSAEPSGDGGLEIRRAEGWGNHGGTIVLMPVVADEEIVNFVLVAIA